MAEKFANAIKNNFGFIVAIATIVMLFGAWYYSTKNLPDRVVCLERQAELNKTAITRHEYQFEKLDAKLDKIIDKQERMLIRLGAKTGGAGE